MLQQLLILQIIPVLVKRGVAPTSPVTVSIILPLSVTNKQPVAQAVESAIGLMPQVPCVSAATPSSVSAKETTHVSLPRLLTLVRLAGLNQMQVVPSLMLLTLSATTSLEALHVAGLTTSPSLLVRSLERQ